MAKIILAADGKTLRELMLSKERLTIGRSPHNDLVIDSRAISAEHAVIVTLNNDSFLEDLNSTNGTQVNGQPIKKHFLQDGDVIELAQYRISYFADSRPDEVANLPTHARAGEVPRIKVLNGPHAGKEVTLTKALTTLGWPDVQVAAIARRAQGYCLMYVEGDKNLRVNGSLVGDEGHVMAHGDVIDLAGTRMEFFVGG